MGLPFYQEIFLTFCEGREIFRILFGNLMFSTSLKGEGVAIKMSSDILVLCLYGHHHLSHEGLWDIMEESPLKS